VVDDNIRQVLISRYPKVSHKVHVIPNGYDPDDFESVERPRAFTMAYLGTIRDERNPQSIINAIERFKAEYSIKVDDISFKFIGHVQPKYLDLIKQYSFTTATGHLPYQKAIKEFCASHLAVLITTGSRYFFPSRQNEYLASGLPVVVCGESKGLHLLEEAFKQGYPGWIFDYHDIEGMSERIADVYKKYKRGKVVKGITPYKQYTRRNLTKMLAELVHKT
jgi:glycosyltransferase involved in cell wall biosynthesis